MMMSCERTDTYPARAGRARGRSIRRAIGCTHRKVVASELDVVPCGGYVVARTSDVVPFGRTVVAIAPDDDASRVRVITGAAAASRAIGTPRHSRFMATRSRLALSRFDQMSLQTRRMGPRFCRMAPRSDLRRANSCARASAFTRCARALVPRSRSRPRGESCGPNVDAIASRVPANASCVPPFAFRVPALGLRGRAIGLRSWVSSFDDTSLEPPDTVDSVGPRSTRK
jgi:hypothetical protein